MKKIIICIVLYISLVIPIHSNAETRHNYLIYDSETNIQEMMNEFPTFTKAFDVVPMIEIQLTSSEKNNLKEKYPNSTISEVQIYETAATVDTVPFQFPLINAEPKNTTPYTGKGVKVAVIDSGIDAQHADLKIAGGVCTLKTNCPTSPSYDDDNGHGTHVAGVIAAQKNNFGLIGVAPNVELYAVKVMTRTGGGTTTNIAAGVEWAIKQKVDIINMSLTTTGDDQALKLLLEKAYAEGITIVASAGNEGSNIQSDSVQYPAKYPTVIAVSATTGFNKLLVGSSIGPEVELAAPGDEIISTYPSELDTIDGNKDGYSTFSGTSMAAPHVTGVLALYKERFPHFTNKRLRELISNTAEDLGATGRDQSFGYGLIKYKQEITEIPYPIVEEQDGKIIISIQNSVEVTNAQLISNNEVIQTSKVNQWEIYRLKGDYSFTITYLDKNNIQQKDTLHINVAKPSYPDIGALKWYAPHVSYLSHNKLIFGHLDGTFKPDKLISRAEAVALLGRVYGLNGEPKKTSFSDVSAGSFASGYIQSALEAGLISGFPDKTFRPDQSVSRAEMAILLQNAYEFKVNSAIELKYTDVSNGMVSYESIQALEQAGITKGYSETQFKPETFMSRATYSVFIARAERSDLFK